MPHHNPETTHCTALTTRGKFCDNPSLPDAPFPICVKHAARLLAYLNDYAPKDLASSLLVGLRANSQDRERKRPAPQGFVYYLRVGRLIKIGHTTQPLGKRLGAYPPDAVLLVIEPGTRSLEAQRHREFADELRHRNEWFEPSARLMLHIARLRDKAA